MSSNVSPTSALPVFDPTQTRLDGWIKVEKRQKQEHEVVQIPFNKDLIDAIGEPVSVLFWVSDHLKYQVTCPKEFLKTASTYFSPILEGNWFREDSPKEFDLRNHDVVYSKEHFKFLSDYINIITPSSDQELTLADFKAYYTLSSLLQIKEIREVAEEKIVHLVKRDHTLWSECLSFGMRHTCSSIVKAALEICVREYEKFGVQSAAKQYLLNNLSLIKKGASHVKNSAKANRLVEVAQKVFDEYVTKKNEDKAHKIYRSFEYGCKYSKELQRPKLLKQLASLKKLVNLYEHKDEDEKQSELKKLDQLFQEYEARMLEAGGDDDQQ